MSERLASSEIAPSVGDLQGWLAQLGGGWPVEDDNASLVDQIALLERVKAAAGAAQARLTVAFKQSTVAERKQAGVRARDLTKGIGSEIALARQQSTYWGGRFVGFSEALVHEMPHTLTSLTTGDVSEYRASLLVAETACLSVEDRGEVDRRLKGRLGGMGDKQIEAEAKKIAYELDPHSVVDRSRKAEQDRRVTSWPAPDTMMNVCALLPVTQGAAVMAALTRAADQGRAGGDERSRGQLMADTFVERLTGQTRADQTPVEVQLVMTDRTLFGDDHTPAWLTGHGPVPAAFARILLRRLDDDTLAWIRRVFTDPCTGLVTAVDARRRLITGPLRRTVIIRDRWCRTPWCNAPIRHGDHVIAVEDGGQTTEANSQGLCEACNYAKQAHGWRARPGPGGAGVSVEITTPTGHTYQSRPPPLPGAPWPDRERDAMPRQIPAIEIYLRNPFDVEYAA
jgi:HNH endonuclease